MGRGTVCAYIHLEARSQWQVSSSIHFTNWDKVSHWSWSSLVLPLYPKIPCPAFWALGLQASCYAQQPIFQVGSEDPTLALKLYPLSHLSSPRCSITQITHASSREGWGEQESKIYSMKTGVCKTVNHSHCYEANNWLQRIYCYTRLIVK